MSARSLRCIALCSLICGALAPAASSALPRRMAVPTTNSGAAAKPSHSPAQAPEPPVTASNMTAQQILERNAAARGGLQAWRSVESLSIKGTLDAGDKKDAQLPYSLQMKRPHKTRLEIEFRGQTAVQVYDGQKGWKLRPYLGRNTPEPYSADEMKRAAAQLDIDGLLIDAAAKGNKVEVEGMQRVEGRDAYRLKVTVKSGEARRVWVDAQSFLEMRIEGGERVLDGRLRKVTSYLRDYRMENGLMMPHVSETALEGVKETHKMTAEKIMVNAPLADGLFDKPASLLNRITVPQVIQQSDAVPGEGGATAAVALPTGSPGSAVLIPAQATGDSASR